jgi:transcriptional regulator
MYSPKTFEETNLATLHALVRAHPLGTWVTHGNGDLTVNHVPFLLRADIGPYGTLVGHVARANPVWQTLDGAARSIAVFQGADSYITPSWYPSKHATGKAVPTWNYAVVHAHGAPRAIDDAGWLLSHLEELTSTHEAHQALPWKISDAPAGYVERLIESIVGIEMPIEKIEGKWKVSQNRTPADRTGVVAGLMGKGSAAAEAMAQLVRERASP